MKRGLLTIVPALMLLGSCASAQPRVANNLFQEDTLAHEEIFGKAEDSLGKVRRNVVEPKTPIMKVQRKDNGDSYSIRFVAAVELGDLPTTTVTWTRTMYSANGEIFKDKKSFESSKVYTKLFDGEGQEYTIDQAEYSGYTHFAVYTMLNIPKTTYDKYYLNAYVTISGEGSTGVTSDISSTTIDLSKRVSFPAVSEGYFIKGVSNDSETIIHSADEPTQLADYNNASFTRTFAENDVFYIVNNDTANKKFQVFGYSDLIDPDSRFSSYGEAIKANGNGDYIIYCDKDGSLKTYAYAAVVNGAVIPLQENVDTDTSDGRLAEYYGELTATAGDAILFIDNNVIIDSNIGADLKPGTSDLVSGNNVTSDLKVRTSSTFTTYLKVYDGGYSVWAGGFMPEQRTYNLDLGSFAESNKYILLRAWGGERGEYDKVIYEGSGDLPTSFTIDSDSTGYLFARLKEGETDYGQNWGNVELQRDGKVNSGHDDISSALPPTIVYMTDGDGYFEYAYSGTQLTFGLTYSVENGKAIYIAGVMFDGWSTQIKLTNDGNNNWSTTQNITPGSYRYKYIIADDSSFENADWDKLNSTDRWIMVV